MHRMELQNWINVEEEILQGKCPELEEEYARLLRNEMYFENHCNEINVDPEIDACFMQFDMIERTSFR